MDDKSFSILERYGEDFTKKEYVTNPAIGREEQLKKLLLILLTPEKSAILIGYPGTGKTAIVEGLAYLIEKDQVPEALKGYTIINIKTASLLGTMPNGESKVQLMIDELKQRDKVILFVDEIHMLIGATDESSLDFANIFKEGLGRGSIKVVGATTIEEYERYILRDKAFTRRFQKVDVPEPTREESIEICVGTLPKIEKSTGARLKYSKYQQRLIMESIVDITSEYKRVFEINSRYPDVCLTLLKSAFSFAVFDNRTEVNIFDFEKAIEGTHLVYPDVIKKELPKFKEKFKDIYNEEKGIVKEGIDLSKNNFSSSIESKPSDTLTFDASLLSGVVLNNVSNTEPVQNIAVSTPTSLYEQSTNQNLVDVQPVVATQVQEVVEPAQSVISQAVEQSPINTNINASIVNDYSNMQYINPGMIANTRRDTLESPSRFDVSQIDGILTNNPVGSETKPTEINLDLDSSDSDDDDFLYE